HFFSLAATIFSVAALLGILGTLLNEDVAGIVLSPRLIEFIHRREMWTEGVFEIMPGSIMSTTIFTNNITVAFVTFALGITFGIGTCYLLALNGLMLGCVTSLCWRYGMLDKLLAFITAHGVVEISIIIVAGAAGLMLGSALMNPGDYSRRDALTVRGHDAVKLVLGTAPLLVIIGMVEGYISPQPMIPAAVKMALGLVLGALFYLHLLLGGRVTEGRAVSLPGTG
ncbi:MAG TPA: stage II sporulation protein M, partial [Verrucomicrobiae bacterium]|nr:stage II sporulation protein M [Verrucomicrobiae bacterium]